MALVEAKRVHVEANTRKLVRHLTGFQEKSQEFQQCLKFAESNFRFHRFLDINSHKVKRTIEGMCLKFEIHSQKEKVLELRKLTDELLNKPLPYASNEETQSEDHFGVLSFLLNLANNPTNSDLTPAPRQPDKEPEEKFDWGKYLLEGLEPLPQLGSSDDEEWSDLEDTITGIDTTLSGTIGTSEGAPNLEPVQEVARQSGVRGQPEAGSDWLTANVVASYWESSQQQSSRPPASSYPAANLAHLWDEHRSRIDLFHHRMPTSAFTEAHVVRETLWLMAGRRDLFVYVYCPDNECLTPREDICLSHLTPLTLKTALKEFARYGTVVNRLRSFVDRVTAAPSGAKGVQNHLRPFSLTYQAFTDALSKYLQNFNQQLNKIERRLIDQDAGMTLEMLLQELKQSRFSQLVALQSVYSQGVESAGPGECQAAQASRLLNSLYCNIMEQEAAETSTFSLLLELWALTIRPYLEFIDKWVSTGALLDPAQEFILQRNGEISPTDQKFWSQGVVPAAGVATLFLDPILPHLLRAGKSVELLQSLQALPPTNGDSDNQHSSIYSSFAHQIFQQSEHRLTHPQMTPLTLTTSSQLTPTKPTGVDPGTQLLLETGVLVQPQIVHSFASLLGNVDCLFPTWSSAGTSSDTGTITSMTGLPAAPARHVSPLALELTLRRHLYPLVAAKCNRVSQHLIDLLKTKYRLLDYLAYFRRFFLLEAGDAMYAFYSELFTKMERREPWRNTFYLNMQLQQSLSQHCPQEAPRLTLTLEGGGAAARSRSPIHALDGLLMHYEVPWPTCMVASQACQTLYYNPVFRFLLQVKRAKHGLDQLKFQDIARSFEHSSDFSAKEKQQLLHRIHLFKFRLMNFINSLHNYLMTRILHTTGLKFQGEFERAHGVDELIALHTDFVKTIYDRCLLHQGMNYVREAILKIFSLALSFTGKWRAGIDSLSIEALSKLESEFQKCFLFLKNLLTNAVKRKTFPHLEALLMSVTGEH